MGESSAAQPQCKHLNKKNDGPESLKVLTNPQQSCSQNQINHSTLLSLLVPVLVTCTFRRREDEKQQFLTPEVYTEWPG